MTALVALGANLGAREEALGGAIRALDASGAIAIERVSRLYETEPVDAPPGSPSFLNACLRGSTRLGARELLQALLDVEVAAGRERTGRNHPRTLDLDLLLHGASLCSSPDLVLPHPRMTLRSFVLAPAVEIASELRHPVTGLSLRRHLALLGPHRGIRALDRADWPPRP